MSDLLPCPFCGSDNLLTDDKGTACKECGAIGPELAAWNRRAPTAQAPAAQPVAWAYMYMGEFCEAYRWREDAEVRVARANETRPAYKNKRDVRPLFAAPIPAPEADVQEPVAEIAREFVQWCDDGALTGSDRDMFVRRFREALAAAPPDVQEDAARHDHGFQQHISAQLSMPVRCGTCGAIVDAARAGEEGR